MTHRAVRYHIGRAVVIYRAVRDLEASKNRHFSISRLKEEGELLELCERRDYPAVDGCSVQEAPFSHRAPVWVRGQSSEERDPQLRKWCH